MKLPIAIFLIALLGCKSSERLVGLNSANEACQYLADEFKVKFSVDETYESDPGYPEFRCELKLDDKGSVYYGGKDLLGAVRILKFQKNIIYRAKFRQCANKLGCYNEDLKSEARLSCFYTCSDKTGYKVFEE